MAGENGLGLLGTSWHTLLSNLDKRAVTAEAAWNPARAAESVKLYNGTGIVGGWLEQMMMPPLAVGGGYAPVDLSPFVNVSLSDEKPGDGRGWLDYGPLRDLRDFPVGELTLRGVPFRIANGERNAVMLWSPIPPCNRLPKQVADIAINRKARRLHILHGCGFRMLFRPQVMVSRLVDEDGQKIDVPIRFGRELCC